jgi:hypothetical protein
MTISPDVKVTTRILWQGTLIFALIDIVFISILKWRIKPEAFGHTKWTLVITTGVFWSLLFLVLMSWIFWDPVYHHVFPGWARWLVPPAYGLLFAAVGLLFWWLASRLPGNPVINYCLLGGLWGMITHIWAVCRGLLDKVPMLQGASPVAAIIMPIFEFIFYWCISLAIASVLKPKQSAGLATASLEME